MEKYLSVKQITVFTNGMVLTRINVDIFRLAYKSYDILAFRALFHNFQHKIIAGNPIWSLKTMLML